MLYKEKHGLILITLLTRTVLEGNNLALSTILNDGFDKNRTCCFSGHRPEKLAQNGNINSPQIRRLISMLYLEIENTIENGYTNFITGMARGIDLWAAGYIYEKRIKNPDLKLICAIPYNGHGDSLKSSEKWEYDNIVDSADKVYILEDKYTQNCMQKRNRFMVDNSSKVIAVVDNYRSGTGQTIRYAKSKGIDVHIIDINKNAPILK